MTFACVCERDKEKEGEEVFHTFFAYNHKSEYSLEFRIRAEIYRIQSSKKYSNYLIFLIPKEIVGYRCFKIFGLKRIQSFGNIGSGSQTLVVLPLILPRGLESSSRRPDCAHSRAHTHPPVADRGLVNLGTYTQINNG